jgi:hypothetical protein
VDDLVPCLVCGRVIAPDEHEVAEWDEAGRPLHFHARPCFRLYEAVVGGLWEGAR